MNTSKQTPKLKVFRSNNSELRSSLDITKEVKPPTGRGNVFGSSSMISIDETRTSIPTISGLVYPNTGKFPFPHAGRRDSDSDGEISDECLQKRKSKRFSFSLKPYSDIPPTIKGIAGGLEMIVNEKVLAYHEVVELLGEDGIAQAITQRRYEILNENRERVFLVTRTVDSSIRRFFKKDTACIRIFDLFGNNVLTAIGPRNSSFHFRPETRVKASFGIQFGTITIGGVCSRKYVLTNPSGSVDFTIRGDMNCCTLGSSESWVCNPLDAKYDGNNLDEYVVAKVKKVSENDIFKEYNIDTMSSNKNDYTLLTFRADVKPNPKGFIIIAALIMDYHRSSFLCCSCGCITIFIVLFLFAVICFSATLHLHDA